MGSGIEPFTIGEEDPLRPAHIQVYEREDGLYDWKLVAGNGEIVCSSTQGFGTKGDAVRGADRAVDLMVLGPEVRG